MISLYQIEPPLLFRFDCD